MKFSLIALLAVGLLMASVPTTSGGEVSKKLLKKIAMHLLWDSCYGKQNMKNWYKELKSSVKKCQGLTPTFELDIFEDKVC